MSDTEILNEVLNMVVTNVNGDWCGNDPAEEFQEIANYIWDKRAKQEIKNDEI